MLIDNNMKSVFFFEGYRVDKMSFKGNNECKKNKFNLEYDIDAKILEHIREKNRQIGYVLMTAIIFPGATKKDYPFELIVEMVGKFSTLPNDDSVISHFDKMLLKNGMAIMYPYLRSIVTDASKMANVQPVFLPSMNIVAYLENKSKNSNFA